ncbi:hypothetical protein BDZ45DRAFT_296660 [Acephala macrosclerotiorum]|nr:hypothetical protein BDZ45DRAFT_296660 [Acephala macrosclerotiorum]
MFRGTSIENSRLVLIVCDPAQEVTVVNFGSDKKKAVAGYSGCIPSIPDGIVDIMVFGAILKIFLACLGLVMLLLLLRLGSRQAQTQVYPAQLRPFLPRYRSGYSLEESQASGSGRSFVDRWSVRLTREARAEDHRFQRLVVMISYHKIQNRTRSVRNRPSALRSLIRKSR